MRSLLLLIAVCLTACAPKLTINSAPVDQQLMTACGEKIAEPLTTADQYDTARALGEAIQYGRGCSDRHDQLISAVRAREGYSDSLNKQLEQ